ncbi:hypothetical protein [Roseimaritima ulvae]|uniref:hypothetical protein n=1 Tax=Roseimaritima ulvae TaxID=980254 RepID=UPI0011CE5106|nr:hypothetical protein [Roseimaritima ulvae]
MWFVVLTLVCLIATSIWNKLPPGFDRKFGGIALGVVIVATSYGSGIGAFLVFLTWCISERRRKRILKNLLGHPDGAGPDPEQKSETNGTSST